MKEKHKYIARFYTDNEAWIAQGEFHSIYEAFTAYINSVFEDISPLIRFEIEDITYKTEQYPVNADLFE